MPKQEILSHSAYNTPLTPIPMLVQCFFMHRIQNTIIDPFSKVYHI